MSELTDALRRTASDDNKFMVFGQGRLLRAADALDAQSARIEQLQKALKSADFIMSRWACIADSSEVVIPHDMLDLTTDCIEAVRATMATPDYRMEGRENE